MTTNDSHAAGREILTALDWQPTPGETVQGLGLMATSQGTPGAFSYAAFEALGVIAREAVEAEGEHLQAEDRVKVPWWVIEVLALGWKRYREAPKGTLGKALSLEGTGGRRMLTTLDQLHRNLIFTLKVIELVETTKGTPEALSVENAINQVSERYPDPEDPEKPLISPDRLWHIYGAYRDTVMAAYSRKARPSQP